MANGPVDVEIDIEEFGPIFTGAIYGQMKQALVRINDAIANRVVETVQGVDTRTFKHPTGYARSKVQAHRAAGRVTVDRAIPYDAWLEDGGTRSDIFPGYHAFQQSFRKVDAEAMDIADDIVQEYLIQ